MFMGRIRYRLMHKNLEIQRKFNIKMRQFFGNKILKIASDINSY